MKPAVKYGLIGGLVVLALMTIGFYLTANNTFAYRIFQYAIQLVLLVAVILSVRKADTEIEGPIDLKTGLRSGVTTALIIAVCMALFKFTQQQFTSKPELLKQVNASINTRLEKQPVTDTSISAFKKAVASADSAEKAENYLYAKYMLERASRIKSNNDIVASKLVLINNRMLESISSPLHYIRAMIPYFIFQLLIGMVISFVFTLLLRLKQQNS